jgi:hypothetical protein
MKKNFGSDSRVHTGDKPVYGRDEMNLAEFPIALLGKRPPGQKQLVFVDKIFDESKKQLVNRTLTVTASEPYNLPMSRDEEVILALIQLTAKRNFEEPHVYFTRYELIKLLGWKDDGVSYRRIENSLRLWLGIHLFYDKAWWDKSLQSWVKEGFNIFDSISIYDNETRRKQLARFPDNVHAGLSRVTWGSVIFKSFQSGNIKRLDFDFFTKLETPIAKRMFRFLDKRFYHSKTLEFEIQNFAYNHIGLSSCYDNSNLKVKLRPAIKELEEKRFLLSLPDSERFHSPRRGQHYVVFIRGDFCPQKNLLTPPRTSETSTALSESSITRIVPRTAVKPSKEQLESMAEKFGLKWRPK